MKTTLVTIVVAALAVSSFAQGTLNVLNTLPTTFRSQIYAPQAEDPTVSLIGNNPGMYTGGLLSGSGFTFAVFYGAATVVDRDALSLLITAPFRTGAAAGLIASIVDVAVPGIPPGAQAQLEVRAWDNKIGTATTWGSPLNNIKGRSGMFLSQPLGGEGVFSPDMIGWPSFNIFLNIPEPNTLMLAGLGAAVLLIFRRRQ